MLRRVKHYSYFKALWSPSGLAVQVVLACGHDLNLPCAAEDPYFQVPTPLLDCPYCPPEQERDAPPDDEHPRT